MVEALPSRLEPTLDAPTPIRVITPPAPIKVAYHPVTALVPTFLSLEYSDPSPDIILHIGMAAGRTFYALECTAYRDGYDRLTDVEGFTFSEQESDELWSDCPKTLVPGWEIDEVWRRWRQNVRSDLDLQRSNDPGNFLCGFIYYTSLANLWQENRRHGRLPGGSKSVASEAGAGALASGDGERGGVRRCRNKAEKRIMFLHVPDIENMGKVSNGVEVAEGLIRALVESRRRNLCGEISDGSQVLAKERLDGRDMDAMW